MDPVQLGVVAVLVIAWVLMVRAVILSRQANRILGRRLIELVDEDARDREQPADGPHAPES